MELVAVIAEAVEGIMEAVEDITEVIIVGDIVAEEICNLLSTGINLGTA